MATVQVAQSIQNNPVYSLPFTYINGLNISVYSNTMLAIAPGQARDYNDIIDMPVGYPNLQGNTSPNTYFNGFIAPLLINAAVNGANGLDVGVLAASTQYAVYLIGDSRGYNNVAGLLTLYSNVQNPTLPTGYDSSRLLGFVSTDGSAHFSASTLRNYKNGNAYYVNNISVLSGGNATSFTAVDLSSAIPTTTDTFVLSFLSVIYTPAAANNIVYFRPTGSTATTNLPYVLGAAAATPQQQYVLVGTGVSAAVPKIDYETTSSSDAVSIFVVSYFYTLS